MKLNYLLQKPRAWVAGSLVCCVLHLHAQTAPIITNQPANQVVTNDGTVVFSVGVSGAEPFTNQWLFNGSNLGPIMTTVAGNGNGGFSGDEHAATNATLYPLGVAVDSGGNLYIADQINQRIRKVDTNGIITTVAGNGSATYSGDGGAATNASLYYPSGVTVDSVGNLYIADEDNDRIRKVDTNGIITTVAGNGSSGFAGDGGAATNASLHYPSGVTVDSAGNLYIADEENDRIRMVSTNGIITTVAGSGSFGFSGDGSAATNATLDYPTGVAVDSLGDLFIADSDNSRIREVSTKGIITTVAGNGSSFEGNGSLTFMGDGGAATNASLQDPYGVAVDNIGNLYIADQANDRIRMVATNGIITSIAGNGNGGFSGDGNVATNSTLDYPVGVTVDNGGNLFIADSVNYRIRKVSAWPANLATLTLANLNTNNIGSYSVIVSSSGGSVTSSVAALNMPAFFATQPASQTALLGGSISFGPITGGSLPLSYQWAFNGTNLPGATNANYPVSNAALTNAGLYSLTVTNLYGGVTSQNATLTVADISQPPTNQTMYCGGTTSFGVVMSAAGTYTYQWQFNGTNLPTSGIISTLAGKSSLGYSGDGGVATNASLYYPWGVALDSVGNVYIADYDNSRVRKVGTNGIITTVAGNGTYGYSGDGGQATNATLRYASGVAVDSAGNLFIADFYNYRIRKVSTNGIITTVAGNGAYGYSGDGGAATNADLSYPSGVAVDSVGNLYIADEANERVRKVGTNGIITTVAGNGTYGYSGDGGLAAGASMEYPYAVAVDNAGNVFIADENNRRIRKVNTNGMITTVAGNGMAGFSGDAGLATNASFYPYGVAVDNAGNLYIADRVNSRVREVGTNGIITTIAGNGGIGFSGDGGLANSAMLDYPWSVAADSGGNLFITDNYRVRKVVGTPAYSPLLPTLTVGNLSTNSAGNYSVVIRNASGSITSSVASLAVTLPAVVTVPPVSQIAVAGSSPSFSVAAGGLGPFDYQWYCVNPGTQTPAGAIAVTDYGFTVGAVLTNGGSGYTTVPNVFFVGGGGSGAGGVAGVSNGMVVAITMTNAGSGYASVPVVQIDPPSVLTGETNPVLNLIAVTPNNDGNYSVTVTNNYGSSTSQVATLTVVPCAITVEPPSQTVAAGSSPSFSATVAGVGPFGYQWYFAGTNLLQNATNSMLTLAGVVTNNAGNYTLVVSNAYGNVTSLVVTLLVPPPPFVTTQPVGQTNLAGTAVSFNVAAAGLGPFTYQWQFNGTNLPNTIITTVAGNNNAGFSGDGGAATNASLDYPCGVTFDAAGNLAIADSGNERIRRIDMNGIITTVVGRGGSGYSGDGGAATNASLSFPAGVAFDAFANLFIDDQDNRCIREVDTNGIIITVPGASGFANPSRVILDRSGNMYISDSGANHIYLLSTSGSLTIVAGKGGASFSGDGGPAISAGIDYPIGMSLDASENLFFADNGNNRIRKVATNGIITTIAGNGSATYAGDGRAATNASLAGPQEVALDAAGNLFISDSENKRVRKVNANGIITTVAGGGASYPGDGGAATNAALDLPVGLTFDASGNLFIADYLNARIREVHFAGFPSLTLTNVSTTNAGNYSVVVTGPYGSVTSLVATLTVTIPSTPPQIVTGGANFGFATNNPGGGFGFSFSGAFDQTIVVEGSSNLLNWTPLFTNLMGGSPVYFADPNSTNFPARLYRARLQ